MVDDQTQPDDAPSTQVALDKARRLIREGADQLDRGEAIDGEAVMRQLREKHQRLVDDEQAKSA
ncbi:MAG: hypothetical protein AAGA29_01860 [Planctomycetota bacterium]